MAIRFEEKPRSRSSQFTTRTATLEYFATGTADHATVQLYAALYTPQMFGGLYRQDIIINSVSTTQWEITVPYGPAPLIGSYRLGFDTTGGTVHVTASRQTVGAYGTRLNGQPAAIDDHKGMIGVTQDGIEGADIVVPTLKLTLQFQHDLGIITLPQIKQLARNVGKFNTDYFLTFAPGEVLFLGATGDEGVNTPTSITYQFACSENVSNLSIGTAITGIQKYGHDYVWIQYKDDFVNQTPVKRPISAYVERVYAGIPFVPLFGFGA